MASLAIVDARALRVPNPRLVGCEAMLSQAQRAAGTENALGTLAELSAQIGENAPDFKRLEAVRRTATPGPDAQVVTMVFRGEQVREGARVFRAARERLHETFRHYLFTRPLGEHLVHRALSTALFGVAAFQVIHGAHVLVNEGWTTFTHPAGVLNVLTMPPALVMAYGLLASATAKYASFEPYPDQINERLDAVVGGKVKGPIIRFEYLRADAPVVSELLGRGLSEQTRNEAYRRLTSSFVGDVVDYLRMAESPEQAVRMVQDRRGLSMYHVIYYDEAKKEPVWIFVLRSQRKRTNHPGPSRGVRAKAPELGLAG